MLRDHRSLPLSSRTRLRLRHGVFCSLNLWSIRSLARCLSIVHLGVSFPHQTQSEILRVHFLTTNTVSNRGRKKEPHQQTLQLLHRPGNPLPQGPKNRLGLLDRLFLTHAPRSVRFTKNLTRGMKSFLPWNKTSSSSSSSSSGHVAQLKNNSLTHSLTHSHVKTKLDESKCSYLLPQPEFHIPDTVVVVVVALTTAAGLQLLYPPLLGC